jgi:hypothetical protein
VPVTYLASDDLEEPARDGLSEMQRRVLWAAETVGYELALKRIMNVPSATTEVTADATAKPAQGTTRSRRKQT